MGEGGEVGGGVGFVQVGMRMMGGNGSGGNVGDGEQWGAADEASLAPWPLTSCCAAQFLPGCRPVPDHGWGVGDPCCKGLSVFKVKAP